MKWNPVWPRLWNVTAGDLVMQVGRLPEFLYDS